MKKLFIYTTLSVGLLAASGCTKNLTDLNQEIKRPEAVDPAALVSSSQKELTDAITSTNVNLNIFRLISQHWAQTTYTTESRYNIKTRSIPDNYWSAIYKDAISDLQQAKSTIEKNAELDAGVKKNQLAIIDVLTVYAYSILVNTYGNVPYTDAINIENIFPKYDDAKAIYDDLFKRLDADLAAFNATAGTGTVGSGDLFFRGDVNQWKRFANSLKLRLGLMIIDASPAQAKTIIEQAAPNVITSNDQNVKFPYSTVPPNTNPLWEDLIQSGRQDFVAANTLVDAMNTLSDPRRTVYFTTVDGIYKGGTYGASGNTYTLNSRASATFEKKDLPGVILDYAEVEFLLAEAVERNLAVGGTAQEHYNKAIQASFAYWGLSAEQANAYLAQPAVAYTTAAGNYKQKIGTQKWIALYNRGFDAWVEWRRLDYPALKAPAGATSVIPLRFTYPIVEQNVNKQNYDQAAAAVGGDVVATKLFWDKF